MNYFNKNLKPKMMNSISLKSNLNQREILFYSKKIKKFKREKNNIKEKEKNTKECFKNYKSRKIKN